MRFSAHQRLRKAEDFRELRRSGLRVNHGPFLTVFLKRQSGPSRLGVIASKKVGDAVKRNRAKRMFREIFRKNQDLPPPSSDMLIIVRSNFDKYSFTQLEERFINACKTYSNINDSDK